MKSGSIQRIGGAAALLALFSLTSAFAQTIRVNVPFAFRAGEEVLPAGRYVVQADSTFNRISIRLLEGTAAAHLNAVSAVRKTRTEAGMLVFRKLGNLYFLHEMWGGSRTGGYELLPSKAEREMARTHSAQEIAHLSRPD